MSIVVQNLVKTYGTQKAVNNISFTINRGEIVGFLGPNGAGKSTTMKIITGYLAQDGGAATVCDLDVTRQPLEAKRKVGYLPESNPLYYDMYVKEYLSFVAGVYNVRNTKEAVGKVVELVGLVPEKHKKIGQLSKGYKQRVGLAAALIHDPEVLILDEPTTGLDPNQIVEIRNVIKTQGINKTVLFSSHIMQEVQAICDRVIIINKGELVADDKLSALQQNRDTNVVRVSFKESLEAAWLLRLPAVIKATKDNNQFWILQTNNTADARKQLLELALKENLNIVSLTTDENNLEEVFRSLTKTA
ncbi:gliding motility-associated ABC transporter ATP-binding subunit GldA [Panacibacter sp. DH6]|uniref:Gliding motility-associated ABC transporter ATP-binding subunit GldA n=1 Tax=Panacibacter microcysteis TaxID=2793269 RepID=A0A931DYI8_9BACT|nr:gliding motility-associated ABC transporter ATP-binding subunit GldA [Panacibacter microcysteis]MBG9375292.1 gliding motility-associated ABC transporter ATP-binding subunit GldA [Panacibacter microcysteis]